MEEFPKRGSRREQRVGCSTSSSTIRGDGPPERYFLLFFLVFLVFLFVFFAERFAAFFAAAFLTAFFLSLRFLDLATLPPLSFFSLLEELLEFFLPFFGSSQSTV
jgi:hypothetical protein